MGPLSTAGPPLLRTFGTEILAPLSRERGRRALSCQTLLASALDASCIDSNPRALRSTVHPRWLRAALPVPAVRRAPGVSGHASRRCRRRLVGSVHHAWKTSRPVHRSPSSCTPVRAQVLGSRLPRAWRALGQPMYRVTEGIHLPPAARPSTSRSQRRCEWAPSALGQGPGVASSKELLTPLVLDLRGHAAGGHVKKRGNSEEPIEGPHSREEVGSVVQGAFDRGSRAVVAPANGYEAGACFGG